LQNIRQCSILVYMSEQYFEEIGCEEFYGEDFLQEYYESLDTDDLD